jgi:hypothetical protein
MSSDIHPIIIDIEASGFGCTSYPIEVGVALENNQKFCSLILPAPEWTHWDEDAEKIHHIERSVLEINGKTPKEVATQLNKILKGKTVYSDGWSFDKPWVNTLFQEARIQMEFHVSALEMILSEAQMENWYKTKDQVAKDLGLTRHRASNDAWIIQETYKRTLDMPGSIKN